MSRIATTDCAREFTAFVEDRGTTLARTAYLIAGDEHRAEDVLQTALAETYVRWHKLRRPEAAEAYVRRAIVTANAAWWRRRSSRETPHDDLPHGVLSDQADELVVRHTLLPLLRQLSPRQRAVIVLRFFDDLSEAETAKALGCSAGAVKQHTARGLERLRVLMHESPELLPRGLQLVAQGSAC
jgi:RNA polymerase sigma-70 factor (sigma-E family)